MLVGGMESLSEQLANTLCDDERKRKTAENYLKSIESDPSYLSSLLKLILDNSIHSSVRLAASVTVKNFIKNFWSPDIETGDRIPASVRDITRTQILDAVLSVSGGLRPQLSEAIALIWREDFPDKWPSLIPDLVNRIVNRGGDINMILGLLETTHTLFKRYRHECAGNALYGEMKMVIGQFGQPLTELGKNLLNSLSDGQSISDSGRLDSVLHSLLFVCKIFFSLNCQDLPEFFEDHMEEWMTMFQKLLRFDPVSLNSVTKVAPPVVEHIKSQVCDNISLYASKYEAEFAPYLPNFVTDVWDLLVSSDAQSQHDELIGNAIEFLAAVVARPQHRHLFERGEALQNLCEKVILPNMRFSVSDEDMFWNNPEEYMRIDLEDSDSHSRRHASCHLVHVLCQAFEGPVVDNFSKYIDSLLLEYSSSAHGSAWISKDTALLLVTSVAARGKTEKLGVTVSTKLVNIPCFFNVHVLPELQNPNANHLPIIKADCLRYAIAFRSLIQTNDLLQLINLIPNLLQAESVVVQSYASVLLEKLFTLKVPGDPNAAVIQKEHIQNPDTLIGRLLAILSSENGENPYVIRALMQTCCVLEERCLPSMNSIMSTLLARLINSVKNPCKPVFNHFLFETICLCVRITCGIESGAIQQFESALFPVFQDILQNDSSDLMPYVFQLLSVCLEQYPHSEQVRQLCSLPAPTSSIQPSPAYSVLLPRLLVPALWDQRGLIPSLSRLLHAYLLHNMDLIISLNQFSAILGAYQRMVVSSLYDVHSFLLLDAIILATPNDVLQSYMRQIFMLIFKRLQASKAEKFRKGFVWFISRYALFRSPNELIKLVDSLQANLFARVLEKVLVPHTEATICTPLMLSGFSFGKPVVGNMMFTHWRQVCMGLIRLVSESDDLISPKAPGQYFNFWAPLVTAIIQGMIAGPGRLGLAAAEAAVATRNQSNSFSANEERFTDINPDATGSQSALGQLAFASCKFPQCPAALNDPRLALANALHQLTSNHPNLLASSLKPNLDNQTETFLQQCLSSCGVSS